MKSVLWKINGVPELTGNPSPSSEGQDTKSALGAIILEGRLELASNMFSTRVSHMVAK